MTDLRRPTLGVLLLLSLVLWVGGHLRRGLWEPDEARYAYVAREMRANDDWFVMHLHDEPYPDKPPLMFWLMNVAAVFTGGEINGFSARLPSLLGAVLALWATARLMERWRDRAAAWRAVAVLMTSFLFWKQGGWGQIDMLLCGLEMMCLWCLFTGTDPGGGRRLVAAYLFAGFAVLAKGPIGLVMPLVVYAAASWASGETRHLRRAHWFWGIPLACAIPGVWLLLAWQAGGPPEYFQAALGAKSFARVLEGDHGQPFYYYIPHFITEFLPWTVFLPAAYRGLGPGAERRRLVAWTLAVIVLFSLFHTKRNLYILLAYPGAAMLVAAGWDGIAGLTRRWQAVTGRIALGLIITIGLAETGVLVAALAGLIKNADRVLGPNPHAPWLLVPCALLMLFGSTLLIGWFKRDGLTRRWLGGYAAVMFVHWMLVDLLVQPALNETKAPVTLAAEARTQLPPDQPIHVYDKQLAIIALYADRPGRYLRTAEEVEQVISSGTYGIIVFHQADWDEFAPRFGDRVRTRPFRMGSKRLVWVDFPPPVAAQP